MKSEQEVIKILQENGIEVIMKPVALLPDYQVNNYGFEGKTNGIIETDIYEALKRLEVRKKFIKDPFS